MKKKKIFIILGVVLALYIVLWLTFPYSTYNKANKARGDFEIDASMPGLLSGPTVDVKVSGYASLVIEYTFFGKADYYVALAGVERDYLIPIDTDIIPINAINEECEILFDTVRDELITAYSWVTETF